MQDRYAGDVGDFGKIGLLKCLQKHGFTIGVNWYRVRPLDNEMNNDGSFKQDDGKHLISEKIKECDASLADKLTDIAKNDRSVESIQNADLIPEAIYYDEYLTVDGREEWNKKAKSILAEADLVFLDPDNGLLVKSVGKRSAKSIKYAFYEEVKGYIESGKSVLIYNHRSRKSENEYFDEIEKLLEDSLRVSRNTIQTITFPKGSVRDYFAVPVSEEHYNMIFEAFKDMKYSKWGQSGVCRLHPEWADEIYVKYRTYDEYLFLDEESTHFSEDMSLEDYRCAITRYLMLCGYNYSEEAASSLVRNYDKSIRGSFLNKEPVDSVALDIGYGCG